MSPTHTSTKMLWELLLHPWSQKELKLLGCVSLCTMPPQSWTHSHSQKIWCKHHRSGPFCQLCFPCSTIAKQRLPTLLLQKQSCLSLFRWFGATCLVQCCWFYQRKPPCSAPGLTVYSLIAVVNFTMCQTTWGSSWSCLTFTPSGQKSLPWLQSNSAAVISYLDQLLPKRMPCAINTDNGPQFLSGDFIVYLTGKGITS